MRLTCCAHKHRLIYSHTCAKMKTHVWSRWCRGFCTCINVINKRVVYCKNKQHNRNVQWNCQMQLHKQPKFKTRNTLVNVKMNLHINTHTHTHTCIQQRSKERGLTRRERKKKRKHAILWNDVSEGKVSVQLLLVALSIINPSTIITN